MYEIKEHVTISGDLAAVWAAATDVGNWSAWDPHEQDARLDGPFMVGARGWSKPRGGLGATWVLTEVDAQHRWASECGLPGGKLAGENVFEPVGNGEVRCTKAVRVSGSLVPLFRLYFGPRMRRDMRETFVALQREAARRSGEDRA